jgi:hypothetical protein
MYCKTTIALTCENLYSDGHVTLFYGNEANLGHTLSNVLSVVALYSTCTRALTFFENFAWWLYLVHVLGR